MFILFYFQFHEFFLGSQMSPAAQAQMQQMKEQIRMQHLEMQKMQAVVVAAQRTNPVPVPVGHRPPGIQSQAGPAVMKRSPAVTPTKNPALSELKFRKKSIFVGQKHIF